MPACRMLRPAIGGRLFLVVLARTFAGAARRILDGGDVLELLASSFPGLLHDPGERTILTSRFGADLLQHRLREVETLFSLVGLAHRRTIPAGRPSRKRCRPARSRRSRLDRSRTESYRCCWCPRTAPAGRNCAGPAPRT